MRMSLGMGGGALSARKGSLRMPNETGTVLVFVATEKSTNEFNIPLVNYKAVHHESAHKSGNIICINRARQMQ